ncbi:MAG: NAD(P)-dependent oxidoreductase [Bacteroidetes bacterium]|nr:NAD(P)-dependent oxidoreductase [Bacteroidota bacterium]
MQKSISSRHILIIGGAGYIGSVLSRQLLQNNYHLRVLDPLIYNNSRSLAELWTDDRFSFIHGDMGNTDTLNQALEGITDVVLLAALVGDPICKKYPELAQKVNDDYPKRLLKTLQGRGIQKFVFSSTCSNYGLQKDDTPADETAELNPQSLYAEAKVGFEKHILEQKTNLDFSPVILRIATAFGISPRMRFDLTISQFTRELALGHKLLVYDENTWRPYCHILDISRAIIRVIESPAEKVSGEVFNVGGDEGNFTKKMVVDLIQRELPNTEFEYHVGDFDPRNYRVNFQKIKNQLGFVPEYSVEKSVKTLIKALKQGFFTDVDENRNFYGNYFIDDM